MTAHAFSDSARGDRGRSRFHWSAIAVCLIGALPAFVSAAGRPDLLAKIGDQPATIVCLGDSVTGVYYHTGGRRAYPEMLELAIRKASPDRQVTVINAGISGNTTRNGLERLERDVLGHKPHVVTVSFGLNDMVRVAPDAFRANLEEIVARCRGAGSQVVLCTPNAVIDTESRPTAKLAVYCDIIRAVGRDKGVPVCDQYEAADSLRRRDAWAWRLTMSDEIHPNMDGHRLMAAELCRTITGRAVSLDEIDPPLPALPGTLGRLKRGDPIRVLATPPYDALIGTALRARDANARIEVTPWAVAGKPLAELERDAQATVRPRKPDLVILALPCVEAADRDESSVRSLSWVLNWSLSFGRQEWDCVVVHPAVAAPGAACPRDGLIRRLVRAQDLHLIERPGGNSDAYEAIFARWIADALR